MDIFYRRIAAEIQPLTIERAELLLGSTESQPLGSDHIKSIVTTVVKREKDDPEGHDEPDSCPSPPQSFAIDPAHYPANCALEVEALQAAINKLPAAERDVLILYYFGGWSPMSIASQLKTTPGNVELHLERARYSLLAQIKFEKAKQ